MNLLSWILIEKEIKLKAAKTETETPIDTNKVSLNLFLPLRTFFAGQQTNSTPLKTSIPHGKSIAKDRSLIDLSVHARPAVPFHWSKFQHFV